MHSSGFREIFIFVAGATPQVITETIYALSLANPPVHPHEVRIITTTLGRKRIQETLIGQGMLRSLTDEYGLPQIALAEESFVVPVGASGEPLEDITTSADNEIMGDLITSLVREKAGDPKVRLHCSLAGGRKAMSFYLGAALQLFGRPWDKLYHVLVTPPEFEGHPDFFYKPKEDKILTPGNSPLPPLTLRGGAEGGGVNTRDAEIHLAELPFIRLGSKLSLRGKGFRDLVQEGQKEIDVAAMQPEIRVSLAERTVKVGEHVVEMVPAELMIYTALLRQKVEHCRYPEREYCRDCTDCYPPLADLASRPALERMAGDYLAIYQGQTHRAEELLERNRDGVDISVLRSSISKINRAFKEQVAEAALLPYCQVRTVRKYAASRYGVGVEKGKVRRIAL